MQMTEQQRSARSQQPITKTDNIGAFRNIVDASFVPLRISTEGVQPFAARLSSVEADDITFTEIHAKPHLVERTPETIADGGSGYYKISLMLSGSSILLQDGKELLMQAGDLSVYDTSRPYSLLFDQEFRTLIMMFPKDRLDIPIQFTEQLTAVALNQLQRGLAPVVTSFLSQFPDGMAHLTDSVRTKLAHTSLDLVSTLFSSILDTDPMQRDPHQIMLQKIYTHIEAHLSNPDLSPGSIAAAHYISMRHLHGLFKLADTTVSTWIRERRLERCRNDLLDPTLSDRTIAGIAARWGFIDPTHFSRVFKTTYSLSPSEIRNQ